MVDVLSVLSALGVFAGACVVILGASFGVATLIGRGIRTADQAAAPTYEETRDVVEADDAYVEALAAGHEPDRDPTLTQMFAAYRDEARAGDGT